MATVELTPKVQKLFTDAGARHGIRYGTTITVTGPSLVGPDEIDRSALTPESMQFLKDGIILDKGYIRARIELIQPSAESYRASIELSGSPHRQGLELFCSVGTSLPPVIQVTPIINFTPNVIRDDFVIRSEPQHQKDALAMFGLIRIAMGLPPEE